MNSFSLTLLGDYVEIKSNSINLSNYKITHKFKLLRVYCDDEILFETDSENYLNFINDKVVLKAKNDINNVFEEEIVDCNNRKLFSIYDQVDFGWRGYLYEYSKVLDWSDGSSFFVKYNPWRFFLPLKMDVIFESEEIEDIIFLSSYIWLKKNMTSHDPLN